MELCGLYKALQGSTIFIFEAPWHGWAQLNGLPGVALVAQTLGSNQLSNALSAGCSVWGGLRKVAMRKAPMRNVLPILLRHEVPLRLKVQSRQDHRAPI